MSDERPVLLVTGHAPPDRAPAFAALHAREGVELALFGGRARHAALDGAAEPVTVAQRDVHGMAASGRYRAVIAGTGGRVALPGAYLGARRAKVPFVLWASLWAHPRSPAHAASYLPTRHLYAHADAVVAYGLHVAAYVRRRGARRVHIAPQAVDPAFWSAPAAHPHRHASFQAVFVGRQDREKGLDVLQEAWRRAALADAHLAVVTGQPAAEVRNFLAGSDVLVIPSRRTATFREPWGLVANEAMHQRLPVIATTEVGAAAGGLVRHERNGLVVDADDPDALAGALVRLHADDALRSTLAGNAARDVASYTPDAWAAGVSAALSEVGVSRRAT